MERMKMSPLTAVEPATTCPGCHTVFLFLLAALTFVSAAQASSPKLNSISPSGGQRGAEMEIRFNGQRLESAQEIIFYSPGIEVLKLDPARTNAPCKARIRIAHDCRLGEQQLRLRTAAGVSELRT